MNISICIPIYNTSPYIERCARSIFEQTYHNWEAIFVDDCSTDDSIKILERILQDYPDVMNRVRIVHHNHNRGLAATRNTGVDVSQGEFVMHVDSDDWLEPTALEVLVKKQQDTDGDIVSGNAVLHTKNGEETLIEPKYNNSHEMTLKMVSMTLDHVIWRRLIRRSLYTANHIHAVENINIGEDHHTLPRLCYYARRVERIDDIVYHYNCMNEKSYTYEGIQKSFNYRRYRDDCNSLKILLNFFNTKDIDVYQKVKIIYTEWLSKKKNEAALLKNFRAYKMISEEINPSHSRLKPYLGYLKIIILFYIKLMVREAVGDKLYLLMHSQKVSLKGKS